MNDFPVLEFEDGGVKYRHNVYTNAAACYGASDRHMTSVMGSGMKLNATHAYPWRMAIAAMTGKGTIRKPAENRTSATGINNMLGMLGLLDVPYMGTDFSSNDWQAKLIRHYPRTAAEVAANAAITRRPKLRLFVESARGKVQK